MRLTVLIALAFAWALGGVATATPIQWATEQGANGHFYELVHATSPILWHDAKLEAESRGGYLATITSVDEHEWVTANIISANTPYDGSVQDVLLGGFHNHQSPIYSEPDLGWEWITGEPWDFTAWRGGEPNGDSTGGDRGDYLAYASFTVPWWNDTGSGFDPDLHRYYVVEYDGPEFSVRDAPADQGGLLQLDWSPFFEGAPALSDSLVSYEAQRLEPGGWTTLATIGASPADSYHVTVPTSDVFTPGQPAPYTMYRVRANTTEPTRFYYSLVDSAYSIDNLPPDPPALSLYDDEAYRSLSWANPSVPDFGNSCLYRGTEPDFEAGDPLLCSPTQYWYQETDLNRYWYRARSFDIHGNASEWSNEVVGRYPTDVPGAPAALRLYPNQPNPFNPVTTIRFEVPVGGRVRLEVYDVAGRLIRSLLDAELPAGSHRAVWDGKDGAGRATASGSYFARLSAGGSVETVRMGLVR